MTGPTPLANGRILPIGESIIGGTSRLKKIFAEFHEQLCLAFSDGAGISEEMTA